MKNQAVTIQYDARKRKPWLVRWYGDYDPALGKQPRYCKCFKRKADAETFRAQKAASFEAGQKRNKPEHLSIKQFSDDWLAIKRQQVRPGTQKIYESAVNRLLGFFGHEMLVSHISPQLAAKFIAELKPLESSAKNAKKTKKERLSDWSRNKVLRACKTIFTSAVEWEMIEKNPFVKVKTPKLVVPAWYYLKPAEYQALLAVTPSLHWKAAYALAYTAGLRFGELFSLAWSNVDFERGEVVIEDRPATSTLPPFHVKDFESRSIPLPKHTLDILTALQAQAQEGVPYVLLNEQQYQTIVAKWKRFQEDKTKHWKNQNMVNNVPRDFKSHLKLAGIKPVGHFSFHTLRKCCGKNWADHLPIHVTKELMGHSSIATTQEFYTQVDADHRTKAAAVGDLLVGAVGGLNN